MIMIVFKNGTRYMSKTSSKSKENMPWLLQFRIPVEFIKMCCAMFTASGTIVLHLHVQPMTAGNPAMIAG